MDLPADVLALLRAPSPGFLATTMPDGSPQLTQTWVDTDGGNVLVNTVEGHQKLRNVRRDPRVALTVVDAQRPGCYVEIRGRVVATTTDGAADHIEALSQRYTGRPYVPYGPDQVRVLLTIEPDRVRSVG
jgi:PPOX class probable F420-dependent enzyme